MSGVRLRGLARSYGAVRVLRGIDLDIASGSVAAILGASGCGKTTLLRLVAGFDAPDAGTIEIGETTVAGAGRWVPPQRRRVGYVAQEGALFPHLTVADNIAFGLPERGRAASQAIHDLLELVGLEALYARRYPHELSGGQQQRIALARALAAQPDIVLLDEPFSSLDAGLREGTRRAIMHALASTRTTTVLVTHDQAEALSVADQVAVMFEGTLAQVGVPAELYSAPATLRVGTFLGEANVLEADLADAQACCELGVVPLRQRGLSGRGTILIRPEQLGLVAPETAGSTPGRVVRSTFYGPSASLEIELLASGRSLTARVPSFQTLPAPGSTVGVLVQGVVAAFATLPGET